MGSWDATWITAKGYTFDLYSNNTLIASVFVKGISASPSPTATPTPTPSPSTSSIVYDDVLNSAWGNWSWDSAIDFASSVFYKGTKAIAFKSTAAWAALRLHNETGIDTSKYTSLEFAAKADSNDKPYGLYLLDSQGKQIGNSLLLSNYGGAPVSDNFKLYTIPLSDFGPKGVVKDIILQDWTGQINGTLYLDEIILK
jgi:hypothetical protein